MCAKAFQPAPRPTSPRNSMTVREAQSIIGGTEETSPLFKEAKTLFGAAKTVWDSREQYRKAIGLVGGIMSARYEMNSECDRSFHEFERLLKRDYQEFARHDNYPAEAAAHDQLLDIFSRMSRIRLAPHLASRNVCAVAGSFSSGKSSFLNSISGGNEDVLPTEITPTTSLPTYIFHVDVGKLTIDIFNHDGGKKQIDKQTFWEMTHSFERKYDVQLKALVDRVAICTPNLKDWKRIALVDTPGYTNPDANQHAKGDRQVALEQLLGCRFLIWVVDCEKGTLPQEDISFIREFLKRPSSKEGPSDRKPIYIVLNKADKKAQERKKILDQVIDISKRNSLPYFGIGLYSAHEDNWYLHHEKPFREFLRLVNQAEVTIDFEREVGSVFDQYIQYHEGECEQFKNMHGLMQRIMLRLDEPDRDKKKQKKRKKSGKLYLDLEEQGHHVNERAKSHEKHAANARSLKKKFEQCTRAFMESCGLRGSVRKYAGLAPHEARRMSYIAALASAVSRQGSSGSEGKGGFT